MLALIIRKKGIILILATGRRVCLSCQPICQCHLHVKCYRYLICVHCPDVSKCVRGSAVRCKLVLLPNLLYVLTTHMIWPWFNCIFNVGIPNNNCAAKRFARFIHTMGCAECRIDECSHVKRKKNITTCRRNLKQQFRKELRINCWVSTLKHHFACISRI